MKLSKTAMFSIVAISVLLVPAVGYCSVESTLGAIQSKLINVILPLAAVLGLVMSAFSFFTRNPNARSHLWLAIIGACVGFGAPSIIAFVRGLVH
ncbi:MAG: hypothetical protein NDI61_08865 [Bdellovibrionaceae bacterium]|nr:hypothetical protein [Pseudobdellovibrionaceae bacterium]